MITLKDKEVAVYKGGYRPAQAFKNGKKLHGYNITGTTELEAEFENTFNDTLSVYGKSGYGNCKNLCPPPESNTTNDGLIGTSISKKLNGKFDLKVTQVDNSGAVMLMSPLVIHSVTLSAGTYTASTNLADIGFCSDDEFLFDLPYTFTLDSEQTVYFGTYNIEIDENDVYIQVEKGETATEYEHYFDPDKDPSPENIKNIISSGGKVETFGQNLFYFKKPANPSDKHITCEWDLENQAIKINGKLSSKETVTGYNFEISNPFFINLEEGDTFINSINLVAGSCSVRGTANIYWGVFSVGTYEGFYYSGRIIETPSNQDRTMLYQTGSIPIDTKKGYKYLAQLIPGTNGEIIFDNAVYKIQISKGSKKRKYSPYLEPCELEVASLNGLVANKEQNYNEETNGEGKFYLSDSLEGNVLTQRIGKKVFTGYESFEVYNELDKTIGFITVGAKCGNGAKSKSLCNAFVTLNTADADEEGVFITEEGKVILRLNKERGINSEEAFKALLADCETSGVPITVLYPLNEAVETSVEKAISTYPRYTRIKTTASDGKMPLGLANCIKTQQLGEN